MLPRLDLIVHIEKYAHSRRKKMIPVVFAWIAVISWPPVFMAIAIGR